jgi:GNAT superfamily N-acetyltransferase
MSNNCDCRIIEEPVSYLSEHALLPSSFCVSRQLEVVLLEAGLAGIAMREIGVERPYSKDYDANEGDTPARWAERWDLANWGLLSAFVGRDRVGGVVLAFDTVGLDMLDRRKDLAVVWDIRVHPAHRRRGIGRTLFRAAEHWARARACRQIKVETQNINVPACRFYANQGCVLGSINRFAYRDFPEEVQLIWYKDVADIAVHQGDDSMPCRAHQR